jgi:hypothetical protein
MGKKEGLVALVIPTAGPLYEFELDPRDSLRQLQAQVDGLIQALPLPSFIPDADRASAYVNEEGHLLDLSPNMRATDFMVPGCGIFFGDWIAGPFLLVGFNSAKGIHAPLPHSVIARARLIESEAGS